MVSSADFLSRLRAINDTAAFNRWCGIEVVDASSGVATIAMPWRSEVGQYSGFLHAGLIGALIDTACGFAAATLTDRVLASHFSVNCLRSLRSMTYPFHSKYALPRLSIKRG